MTRFHFELHFEQNKDGGALQHQLAAINQQTREEHDSVRVLDRLEYRQCAEARCLPLRVRDGSRRVD
jgi:hypothetical protein